MRSAARTLGGQVVDVNAQSAEADRPDRSDARADGPPPLGATPSLARSASAQRRRVLGIVALAGLPLLVLTLIALWQGKTTAEERVAEERVSLARAGAQTTAAFVDGNLSTLRSLGWTRAVRDPWAVSDVQQVYEQVLAQNPDWEGWGLSDASGWNVVSTGREPYTLYIGDRPYFHEALTTDRPVVSSAVLNRRTGNPTIVLAVPVSFERGDRGVAIVSLSSRRLVTELRQLRDEDGIRLAVFDREAKLFVHPNEALIADLTAYPDSPSVQAALRGDTGTAITRDTAGQEALVAYAPVQVTGWGVLAIQPTAAAYDVVNRQNAFAIALFTLAALLALSIAWYLGGRLAEYYGQLQRAKTRAEVDAGALATISIESERRRRFFEGVITSAPVAIAVVRAPDFRHMTVNARYQELQPDTRMVDRTIAEVFPHTVDQGMVDAFRRVAATGEQWIAVDQPWRLAGPDERTETRYFTHVIARLDDDAGGPATLLSIVLESTDAVVARQRAELEKDEFLSIASHELKTPLTSLGLAAQMIDRMLTRGTLDEARLARHVHTIRDQVARASRLIGDLLDVSRIQSDRLDIRPEPVDVLALATTAVQRQRDALPDDGAHELVLHGGERPLVIEGDEGRLDQVLTNLLSNAVKYSPEGGIVEVRVGRDGGDVVVAVVDRGIGVPADERDRLFTPFRRTTSAVRAGVEGTGLGLYITRRIVEAHGGTIGVSDTPGGGATFTVRLPVEGPARHGQDVHGDGRARNNDDTTQQRRHDAA